MIGSLESSWWRRNRLWLALLLPLLLLAVAASSFRLTRLYLPWEWSHPIVAHSTAGTLRQEHKDFDDVTHLRQVRVTVVSIRAAERFGSIQAVPGGVLWQIRLRFEAAPDQILQGCQVELVDAAGVRYGHVGGQVSADSGTPHVPAPHLRCVPLDAPGPVIEPFTGEVVPSPIERPASWEEEVLVAMPRQVQPTQVRVMWSQPEFLVLDLP